ncbi:MAG: extradiol ring-cleavage dioxygenase [Burkholderiaceae bacterium]|nr:extradiol ring-cleavage dioxygenase [Burkholderiaceae bacterium]
MERLPTVFISHGSPMHALDRGAAAHAWEQLGQALPPPKAVLVMSAHWETRQPMLTGAEKPETIHDFSGFPEALYRIQYPAPGDAGLAQRARKLLADAGFGATIDNTRGLDHGAWSPLLHMYPQANVPVVQLSVQPALDARHHYELGRALAPLAGEGVLLLGSGHMTHNLRDWMLNMHQPQPVAYAIEFQSWVGQRIKLHEHEALLDYRNQAPHALRAHPTDEHFLPLFFALGAAGQNAQPQRIYDGIDGGVLAMDAWVFGAG